MTVSEKCEKEQQGFERAFDLVGGRGRFQWILLFIVGLELILLTWNHLGYIFIGAVPNHWCSINELKDANWTSDQIKQLAIPKIANGNNEDLKYDRCHYYDLNYTELLHRYNNDFNDVIRNTNRSGQSLELKECHNWEYDTSIYSSTIVSDYDLVCGRRYLAATIQSTYMVGGLTGTLIFGALNDRVLGRRRSALISIGFVLIGGFLASFSTSYWVFVSIRALIGVGTSGCMQAASVLMLEHCDIATRARFYLIYNTCFGIGYAIMPIYAYFIRDWSSLQLAFSLTTLSLLSYYWIFPESPRWLASVGREDEAMKALQRIAKINRKPEPKQSELLKIIQSCHRHTPESKESNKGIMKKFKDMGSNFKSLLDTREGCKRTLTMWTLFILTGLVYYGFAFSTNLATNPFIFVAVAGMMEIPACIVPIPFLTSWGRRPTMSLCYLLTGLFALAIAITPPEYEFLRVSFTMTGKFFIASAFTVLYLVVTEIYPTVSRSTGKAAGTLMGRCGSIAAPYVADLLTTVYPDLPFIIFGIASLFGASVALLLPEMKDMEMMDQVSELELKQIKPLK